MKGQLKSQTIMMIAMAMLMVIVLSIAVKIFMGL